jgi:hypothetical protein
LAEWERWWVWRGEWEREEEEEEEAWRAWRWERQREIGRGGDVRLRGERRDLVRGWVAARRVLLATVLMALMVANGVLWDCVTGGSQLS